MSPIAGTIAIQMHVLCLAHRCVWPTSGVFGPQVHAHPCFASQASSCACLLLSPWNEMRHGHVGVICHVHRCVQLHCAVKLPCPQTPLRYPLGMRLANSARDIGTQCARPAHIFSSDSFPGTNGPTSRTYRAPPSTAQPVHPLTSPLRVQNQTQSPEATLK